MRSSRVFTQQRRAVDVDRTPVSAQQLAANFRIGNGNPSHAQEISFPFREQLQRGSRIGQAESIVRRTVPRKLKLPRHKHRSDRNDRHIRAPYCLACEKELRPPGERSRRVFCPKARITRSPAGHINSVCSCLDQHSKSDFELG